MRRYLEDDDDFAKVIFLLPYSPFLNPAEWLWRNGKARIRRTFRRPARIYFRREVMSVCESLELKLDSRTIMLRNLGKIPPT